TIAAPLSSVSVLFPVLESLQSGVRFPAFLVMRAIRHSEGSVAGSTPQPWSLHVIIHGLR
ncbi:MAG TPA: hypothetical protein VN415_05510, partial [Dehalococcoidia bacterium]|nr:hypothetical protein [Dehalococcoidia bacterium]